MPERIFPYRNYLIALAVAIGAHLFVFAPLPFVWRAVAVLALTGFIPGWLFVDALLGGPGRRMPEPWERTLYAIGAGYAIAVTVPLVLSFLPGGLTRTQTLVSFDLVILLLVALLALRIHKSTPDPAATTVTEPAVWPDVLPSTHKGWLLAGVLSLLLVGGFLRFNDLGYSEFQGDEARAVMRAAEVIQGYHDALLSHKKGPAEILIPASSYSLMNRTNEAAARVPFAIANMAGLLAIFLLGWRLYHPIAGWATAMLLALDGYFIGFARIVQYQSVVFFTVILVVLVFYRLYRRPFDLWRYLTLAAIFMATGLLAHYEAALVALPVVYLLYAIWRKGLRPAELGKALIAPIIVGGVMLGVFYIPFVLNPSFRVTYAYITVNRIGGSFPYNNLVDVFERTTLYSSIYYLAFVAGCVLVSLITIYRRNLPRWAGWVVAVFILAGMGVTLLQPAWLTIGGQDHTWAFFAIIMAAAWFLPKFPVEQRVAWAWFGGTMLFMLFFTLTPNTHVYGFFIPMTLIAGDVIGRSWTWLSTRFSRRTAEWIAVPVAALLVLLFGNYAFWYFAATDGEVLRTWRENRPVGYPVTYDMPTRMSIFGFPLRNGWKVAGALYADGVLDAPFDVHGKEPVADWYTRGDGYCPRDHVYYIWHESVEPADLGYNTVVREQIEADGYRLFGVVQVNDEPRMRIYKLTDEELTPQTWSLDEFEARFDHELSGPIFEKNGPSAAPAIQNELNFRFGDNIVLRGYSLDRKETEPSQGVLLTLYWQAVNPLETDYSVFTQIIDMETANKVGQRDGEPVCNNLPTTRWLVGDTIIDRYYIPINADAQAGAYTLLTGMYDSGDGSRLEIVTPDGAYIGDAVGLDEITVLPSTVTP